MGLYKNSIPLWKHAQIGTGGVHNHTSAPPTNKKKPWNITCWQSSGNSTKTIPKVSLLCSHTIRAAHLLPTVPQGTGEQRLADSTAWGRTAALPILPFSWWRPHVPSQSSEAAKGLQSISDGSATGAASHHSWPKRFQSGQYFSSAGHTVGCRCQLTGSLLLSVSSGVFQAVTHEESYLKSH